MSLHSQFAYSPFVFVHMDCEPFIIYCSAKTLTGSALASHWAAEADADCGVIYPLAFIVYCLFCSTTFKIMGPPKMMMKKKSKRWNSRFALFNFFSVRWLLRIRYCHWHRGCGVICCPPKLWAIRKFCFFSEICCPKIKIWGWNPLFVLGRFRNKIEILSSSYIICQKFLAVHQKIAIFCPPLFKTYDTSGFELSRT